MAQVRALSGVPFDEHQQKVRQDVLVCDYCLRAYLVQRNHSQ